MAVMASGDRALCKLDFMNETGILRETIIGCLKADVLAAINAADQWASDNAASFNTALPTAFKNNATAPQKARLLRWVIYRRWVTGV